MFIKTYVYYQDDLDSLKPYVHCIADSKTSIRYYVSVIMNTN